jgi:predicted SPOUT superfamily RNA methylase MTH1
LAVFCVDEVVVYNDGTVPAEETGGISEPNSFLAHVLQFLETPQYTHSYIALIKIPTHPFISNAS